MTPYFRTTVLALLAVIALLVFAPLAHATYCTNGAKDYPKCTPPATPGGNTSSSSTSSSSAAAGAAAGANAVGMGGAGGQGGAGGAGGAANASGGNARQGQHQGQSQSAAGTGTGTGGSANDNSSSHLYVLPAPVFTPPMAAVQCPNARIKTRAWAIGWNFISASSGDTDSDDCTALMLRNAYVEECQYASAKQVQDRLSAKVLADFKPSTTFYLDLTREECMALKSPRPVVETRYVMIDVPKVTLPVVPAKPKKRAAAKPCTKVLAPSWQCKAEGLPPAKKGT